MIEPSCRLIAISLPMNIFLPSFSTFIFTYDTRISTHTTKITQLNTFLDFLGFLLFSFELSILPNHTGHSLKCSTVMCYFFCNSKNPGPIHSPRLLAAFFIMNYSEDDFQHILKRVFEIKIPVIILASLKSPWEKLLKTRFPDVYWKKTHIKYYNFC